MIGADFVRALVGREYRAAPAAEAKPGLAEISGNASGFLQLWRPTRWNPDDLVGRRGIAIYDRIRRDDQVKGALALKKGAVLAPGWELTPASEDPEGEDVRDFVDHVFMNMEPLYGSLDDHIYELLSALDYGFAVSEIVWRLLEDPPYAGKYGLRTLKARKPHRFWFDVDAHDNLLPDGIRQDESLKFPVEKFLHYAYQREFGNWYGTSDLRSAYEWWWFKDNLIKWSAIYAERFAIPIARGKYPPGHPEKVDITNLRTMLENLQANTSMTYPNVFEVELLEAGGRGADIMRGFVQEANLGIARALLMPSQLGVSTQPETGTYAQSKTQFNVFLITVEDIRRDIAKDVVEQQLIRRVVHANYGPRPLPTFEFKPLQEEDEQRLLGMWLQAVTAGVVDTTPQDEVHIREVTDFPERTEKEIQAERDRLEAMLPPQPAPGAPPEPGEPPPDETPEEKAAREAEEAAKAKANGKPKAVAKAATWAPPPHGRFVRRVRSRTYYEPDQPRDEGGQWSETGAEDVAEANALHDSLKEDPIRAKKVVRDQERDRYAGKMLKLAGTVERVAKKAGRDDIAEVAKQSRKNIERARDAPKGNDPIFVFENDLIVLHGAIDKLAKPKKAGEGQAVLHYILTREPNAYERKVDFARIEEGQDGLEGEGKARMMEVLERMREALLGTVSKRLEAGDLTPSFVRNLDLKFKGELQRVAREVLGEGYRLGTREGRRMLREKRLQVRLVPGLPPEKALAFFEQKAFYITGVLKDRLLNGARNILYNGIKAGTPGTDVIRELKELFDEYLGDPTAIAPGKEEQAQPYRLETILRTNVNEAYNEGLKDGVDEEVDSGFVIGFLYSAIIDGRQTEVCEFLDGKILRPDTEDTNALTPSNHFQCRSILIPVTKDEGPVEFITAGQIGRALQLKQKGF